MEMQVDILAPFGEILADRGICTREEIDQAYRLQLLRRTAAVRNPLASNFNPVNIIELLIEEQLDDIITEHGGCDCEQCRANAFAMSLNGIAGRYFSDMELLLEKMPGFREEFGVLIQERIIKAVQEVRDNPKLSCSLQTKLASDGDILGTVTVRVSNRHVHLSTDHIEALFGKGYELNKWRDLVQPGQYAARETVTLKGQKGEIERVRVLGPARSESQVEISGTDQFKLGIQAPVRESGDLDGTPGIELTGPEGSVQLEKGVIRAWRHIHMPPAEAEGYRLKNRDMVDVILKGDRTAVLQDVIVRVSDSYALEMHIDTDEANAAGVPQESEAEVLAAG